MQLNGSTTATARRRAFAAEAAQAAAAREEGLATVDDWFDSGAEAEPSHAARLRRLGSSPR